MTHTAWDEKEKQRSKSRLSYFREYVKNKYAENPELRERLKKGVTERGKRLRVEVIKLLGNKCKFCGFTDTRALQIDHVNGGGRIDRHKYGMNFNSMVIKSVKKGENKYQLLCANCNFIKRYTNNEMKTGTGVRKYE